MPSCSPHNNPANFIDTPTVGGRIRTTCRVCGCFIGYRDPDRQQAPSLAREPPTLSADKIAPWPAD